MSVGSLEICHPDSFIGGVIQGSVSGKTSTTGYGVNALQVNAADMGNTAFGGNALNHVISGKGNTAIGNLALNLNVGSFQTAMGQYALQNYIQSGFGDNTAIGFQALQGLNSGVANTALGSQAGYAPNSTTSGMFSNNVLLGYEAGQSLMTGSQNVFVGRQAGGNLLSGSGNVLLGDQAGTAYSGSESNNIVIGTSGVQGESSMVRLSSLIVGNILSGTISIPTPPPFTSGNRYLVIDANGLIRISLNGPTS